MTHVCQDWGGLLGLQLVGEHPERFRRVVDGGRASPRWSPPTTCPFPATATRKGAPVPVLVPTRPDDPASEANRRAGEVHRRFDNPFPCAFSDSDPITRGADRRSMATVPGAAGQRHVTIAGTGHFVQADKGEELAGVVAELNARTPPA